MDHLSSPTLPSNSTRASSAPALTMDLARDPLLAFGDAVRHIL
jgi:hypothetical protein